MIPMPEDSNISRPMAEKEQDDSFSLFLEEKSEINQQNGSVQLCSTPPLSAQEPRKRSSVSPTHFSKKERILQSLMAAAPALLTTPKCENSPVICSRKRPVDQAFSQNASCNQKVAEVAQKRICNDESAKENQPLKLKGTLTLLVVGENGNVLWKESASKEKIVSNFRKFLLRPMSLLTFVFRVDSFKRRVAI